MMKWLQTTWNLYLAYMCGALASLPAAVGFATAVVVYHKPEKTMLLIFIPIGLVCFGLAYDWKLKH